MPCKDITELIELSQDYVQYFNHVRTTLKTKGHDSSRIPKSCLSSLIF
ncbi:IS3 family transposase [Limosilactobacillus reuteri]